MTFYHKRCEKVEAVQFTFRSRLPRWCKAAVKKEGGILMLHTLDGRKTVHHGDWILRLAPQQFDRIDPNIFHSLYEQVNPSAHNSSVPKKRVAKA